MSQPVAIVTGAASGIGLALTKTLLARGFKVCMGDVNATTGASLSKELGPNTLFVQCNVAIYSQLATLFKSAFEWGGNRVDFFAANAGIDDRQAMLEKDEKMSEEVEGVPKELNLITLRVNLDAVLQGMWLFKFFARKNEGRSKGGKIVITASSAGLYPMETNPLYTATKTGLVGLTRATGPKWLAEENITVNCICPAFVPTALCPPHLLPLWPKEHITPMTTVMKAFETFLDHDDMTGESVELSLDQLYFRKQPEWANASQKWIGEEGTEFWKKGYTTVPTPKNGV